MDQHLRIILGRLEGRRRADDFVVDDLDHMEAEFRLHNLAVIVRGIDARARQSQMLLERILSPELAELGCLDRERLVCRTQCRCDRLSGPAAEKVTEDIDWLLLLCSRLRVTAEGQ